MRNSPRAAVSTRDPTHPSLAAPGWRQQVVRENTTTQISVRIHDGTNWATSSMMASSSFIWSLLSHGTLHHGRVTRPRRGLGRGEKGARMEPENLADRRENVPQDLFGRWQWPTAARRLIGLSFASEYLATQHRRPWSEMTGRGGHFFASEHSFGADGGAIKLQLMLYLPKTRGIFHQQS